jgi:hypothetical protein
LLVCFANIISDFLLGISTSLTSFYDDVKTHILKEKGSQPTPKLAPHFMNT